MSVPRKPADKEAKESAPVPRPQGALLPVGMVYVDEVGNRFLRLASIERVSLGRPNKIQRDIALTLYFEFETLIEKRQKTRTYKKLAKQFRLGGDPEKVVSKITKPTRDTDLQGFTWVCVIDGLPVGRVLATFKRHDDGTRTLRGYAVVWGEQEAQQVTFRPTS